MAAPRCLVLGGSGYVGAAACRMLAERGARVAFTYHTGESVARELERELPDAIALRLDLRDAAAVRAGVESIAASMDGLDALVQCAGIGGDAALYRTGAGGRRERLQRIDDAQWDEMMDVTVKSTFVACRAAAPLMDGGGRIVVVGSMDGVKSLPSPQHYAAAKGALRSLVQSLAQELGADGILANLVAPGLLDGGMSRLLGKDLIDEYVEHCSLRRLGTAREVAELVAFLALENTYVNGQAILLDGGL
jgi:3-oxoacyl-[acyl-carrier protein] reductase